MKKDNTFSTKDLVSATYISYNGIKFSSPGYDIETKCWIFDNPERCQELDFELRNSESKVEVIRYESVRRALLGMANVSKKNR